jgi:hypothetical protein
MKPMRAVLIALALAATSAPAGAHHSAAMYDRAKRFTLEGTVKEFQWTNPHVWIEVVSAADGKQWSVECTSINFMTRRGWAPDTLKTGDKIVLVVSPLKDGSKGGAMVSVTSVNGKALALEPQE